jgi:hypothetical protein
MAGVSRKTGGLNLGNGCRARIGVSLMLGLLFFLCARASAEEAMQAFLLKCGASGKNGEIARITKDTDLGTVETLVLDMKKVTDMDVEEIPNDWGVVLKKLNMLGLTRLISTWECDMRFSDKEAQAWGAIRLRAHQVSTLQIIVVHHVREEVFMRVQNNGGELSLQRQ